MSHAKKMSQMYPITIIQFSIFCSDKWVRAAFKAIADGLRLTSKNDSEHAISNFMHYGEDSSLSLASVTPQTILAGASIILYLLRILHAEGAISGHGNGVRGRTSNPFYPLSNSGSNSPWIRGFSCIDNQLHVYVIGHMTHIKLYL